MSRWFRFYADALDNPKVQKLPPELFKAWVNLLCVASKGGGVLPPIEDLAFMLRVDEGRVEAIVADLIGRRLLDRVDGVLAPHEWSVRQYESDSSASRVQRYRDKQRNGVGNVTPAVTVTPPDTEQIQITETEVPTSSDDVSPSPQRAVSVVVGLGGQAEEPDARTDLFRRGLAIMVRRTGLPEPKARNLLGKWLRDVQDEAALIASLIDTAEAMQPAEFIPFITAAVQTRMGARASPSRPVKPGGWDDFMARARA